MPISGKYDFQGIKKFGAAGLRGALASTPYTAWILKGGKLTDLILEFITNWLANNGLVVFNIGAIYIEGELDQKSFDQHIDQAITDISNKGGRDALTAEQKKAIDDEVISAARKFVVLTRPT